MRRQFVGQPIRVLADDFGFAGADLFFQFAEHRHARVLAFVDPALRQLPATGWSFRVGHVGSAGDENQAVAVEQHGSDIGPIRQITHGFRIPVAPR